MGDLVEFSNSNLPFPASANGVDAINNLCSEVTANPNITDKPVYVSQISEYIIQKRRQIEQIEQRATDYQEKSVDYRIKMIAAQQRLDRILKDNNTQ